MDRRPRHRRALRQRIAALVLMVPLSLTACSAADNDAETAGDSKASAVAVGTDPSDAGTASGSIGGSAEFVTAGESFSFTVAFCVIDDVDIAVHGPGKGDASGDPAYMDVSMSRAGSSFMSGGARVDLGSTTDFYELSIDAGHEYQMTFDGKSFELQGDFHFRKDPDRHSGTLTVDCR